MRFRHSCFVALAILAIPQAFAQTGQTPTEMIAFEGTNWRINAREATTQRRLGRDALVLSAGRVWRDDIDFTDGVIEFDVAFDEGTAFIGPMWRAESDRRFEEVYFRTHLSGKPDAVQYTPVENGVSAWQIFSDKNAIAALDLKFGEWNRFKIVVKGDRAELYFNSEMPVLHIPDLKTDSARGYVGLRVSGISNPAAYFSNITFRPLEKGEDIIGAPKQSPQIPAGLISEWQVSEPFAEAKVENALKLNKDASAHLAFSPLQIETNGIGNIARLAARSENQDTVYIRLDINSAKAQMKELKFGYSDRVRIYLNGKRVYSGDAGWRVRDYRFLGTVGFFDSVGLDLRRGDNELLVAVSETFGGWAWAGAIEDRAGITLGD